MEKKENKIIKEKKQTCEAPKATNLQAEAAKAAEKSEAADKVSETAPEEDKAEEPAAEDWKARYDELNDSHLRLRAEFDNYRKRSLREKAELIRSGGETALVALLPVVDDFERALKNLREADKVEAVKEGVELIYNKFTAYLKAQGVQVIDTEGKAFDTEAMDAIAMLPAGSEEQKGKVMDCVQTGYRLQDKVIRHAKVVVGE
ncbi:MAG: nucleotide exchange factor GrpE [Tannerella sp.]|jgi:molecular chaperone GrpE|nr:nucleotide exchange factor GrpE [Tannerella sp.]